MGNCTKKDPLTRQSKQWIEQKHICVIPLYYIGIYQTNKGERA